MQFFIFTNPDSYDFSWEITIIANYRVLILKYVIRINHNINSINKI